MGGAVCSPLVEIWDMPPKPIAPNAFELSRFPKARSHCYRPASNGPFVSPSLDAEDCGEKVSMAVLAPDVGSSPPEAKIQLCD